jgi:hypothetical protein
MRHLKGTWTRAWTVAGPWRKSRNNDSPEAEPAILRVFPHLIRLLKQLAAGTQGLAKRLGIHRNFCEISHFMRKKGGEIN